MDEKINNAIELLLIDLGRAGSKPVPDNALKLSQAVLNLSHAKQLLDFEKSPGKTSK